MSGPDFTFFVGDGSLPERMRWHAAIVEVAACNKGRPPRDVDLVDGLTRGELPGRTTLFGLDVTWACCLRPVMVYGLAPRSLDEARDALPSTCPRCAVPPIHAQAVELLDLLERERSGSLSVVLAYRDGARRRGVVQCFGDTSTKLLDVQVSLIRRLEDEGLLCICRRTPGDRDAPMGLGRIERLVWSGARWR